MKVKKNMRVRKRVTYAASSSEVHFLRITTSGFLFRALSTESLGLANLAGN